MRNLKFKVMGVLAAFFLVTAYLWMLLPTGELRMYDQDLRPMAMTQLEGYCTGMTYFETRGRKADAHAAAQCRKTEDKRDERDLKAVIPAFCDGMIKAGWDGSRYIDCIVPLQDMRMWPTLHGQLSSAFDESGRYPYPGDAFFGAPTDGGGRGNTREDEGDRGGFAR